MLQHPPVTDSIAVKNPVPGGLGRLLNIFFNLPQWVHLALVVAGVVVGGTAAWFAWKYRDAILTWLRTRDRRAKLALGAVGATAVLMAAGGGGYTFWYMEHKNDFCLGCHVMTPAWSKFAKSEHSKLECHDCHRQSQLANARQLVMWIAERPEHIPEHAKLPTRVCARCHIQKPGSDSTWKRIVATAGHRVHLSSTDSALKKVQCVTCHGVEVHAFQPVDKTCAQSGCHVDDKAKIVLGKMAGQTSLHCTGCHEFTRPVAENISIDSTKKALVPASNQCLDCHQMRQKMKGFDPTTDKHAGLCGNCHNPHNDKTPQASWKTCGNAGCHTAPLEETPFHKGIPKAVIGKCESCHEAHTWKADGSSCLTCHDGIFKDAPAAAPRRTAHVDAFTTPVRPTASHRPARDGGWRGVMARFLPIAQTRAPADPPTRATIATTTEDRKPFRHSVHRDLTCSKCHSSSTKHGEVTVKTANDCQSCHHAEDRARGCEGCHRKTEIAAPIAFTRSISFSVSKAPKQKSQTFRHPQHRELECSACHTKGPELAVTKDCASCHTEHHEVERDCRSCHVGTKAQHERSVHQGCGACHKGAEWTALPTARNVCLACHVEMGSHKRGGECADCHKMSGWSAAAGLPASATKTN
jgi:hypothetical protein